MNRLNVAPNGKTTSRVVREMLVRVPSRKDRRFSVLRFHASDNVKIGSQPGNSNEVFMQRENNLKQFRGALPKIEQQNKVGAESEFNRDAKDEARLRRLGKNVSQVYRAEDQPWLMTIGKGNSARKFRGIREGTLSDNVQYFMFCQTKDGNFDAFPIQDWYNMSTEVNYRYLRDEEAEAEFSKLNKTKNLFNVMVKRKIDGASNEESEEIKKIGKSANGSSLSKRKSFKLTDLEDAPVSDVDEEDEIEANGQGEDKKGESIQLTAEDKVKRKKEMLEKERKKQRAQLLARKRQNVKLRKSKHHKKGDPYDSNEDEYDYLDDEAEDESDPDDHLGDEVDYMTNSSSDEDKLSDEELEKLYEAPGVDEEAGLKALLTDISSSEDESDSKKDAKSKEKQGNGKEDGGSGVEESSTDRRKKPSKTKKRSSSSESESSAGSDSQNASTSSDDSSDNDSDEAEDFEAKNTKKLELLQQLSRNVLSSPTGQNSPLESGDSSNIKKREPIPINNDLSKKAKVENLETSGSSQAESELVIAVKKYLHRKPITVTDLLKKIKTKRLVSNNVNAQVALADVLKKLRPIKTIVNGQHVLYLK